MWQTPALVWKLQRHCSWDGSWIHPSCIYNTQYTSWRKSNCYVCNNSCGSKPTWMHNRKDHSYIYIHTITRTHCFECSFIWLTKCIPPLRSIDATAEEAYVCTPYPVYIHKFQWYLRHKTFVRTQYYIQAQKGHSSGWYWRRGTKILTALTQY